MNWREVVRPEVEQDVSDAADWYDSQQAGLGGEFREEVIQVLDALVVNPLLYSRRHPRKDIRWRYPERFPYRVIYEVRETRHFASSEAGTPQAVTMQVDVSARRSNARGPGRGAAFTPLQHTH